MRMNHLLASVTSHLPGSRHVASRALMAIVAALAVIILWSLVAGPDARSQNVKTELPTARVNAPDFPAGFAWLNTKTPLSLKGNLKGHVVVLDFWTYGCINCMHILPDLEYLETKYAGQPFMVVGVHSAKFENEREADNIGKAVQRYRIHHPVIVDEDFRIWRSYGARAWPTFAIIDAEGKVVGTASGEGNRELLDSVVGQLLKEGKDKGILAAEPLKLPPQSTDPGPDKLYFPGKIIADPVGKRFFIADSQHNRIVVADAAGAVKQVIGSGRRGYKDGPSADAQFANPQGMALDAAANVLYLADTDNHVVRKINLADGQAGTLVGTGKQTYDRRGGGAGAKQGLASPWDVALDESQGKKRLFIAMAGTHQLWVCDLVTGVARAFAGSGAEDITDGPAASATLSQPSGLTILGDWLYFADSEDSGIRRAALADGRVETLIGKGLFEFGFQDGSWDKAMLQHPLGLAVLDGAILVADTYNHRVRRIDLASKTIGTLYGGKIEQLYEPGGLAVLDGQIYVVDTNNHRLVKLDPKTKSAGVLELKFPGP